MPAMIHAQYHWKLTTGPWGDAPSLLAVSSNGDYLAVRANRLFRSTDDGSTWQRMRVPTNLGNYSELVTLPGGKIIAHIGPAVFRMDSDGANFTNLSFPNRRNFFADRYGVLYAVSTNVTISKSTDAGDTWNPVNGPSGESLNDFATDGNMYYGTTASGIQLSSDHGATWRRALNGITTSAFYSMIAGENGNAWALSVDGSYWTGDAGAHWHTTSQKLDFHSRVVPGKGNHGMFNGQYVSGDTITSAKAPGSGPFIFDSSGHWLCAASNGTNNLFVAKTDWAWKPISLPLATASYILRAYQSVFAGFYGTEYLLDNAYVWGKFCDCGSSPTAMNYVDGSLLSLGNGVLNRSIDFGRTWKNILSGAIPKSQVSAVALPPRRIYAGTLGLYFTDDTGYTWNEANDTRLTGTITALCADSARQLYAACSAGLFLSSDAGDTWSPLNWPTKRAVTKLFANARNTIVAVGSTDTLFSSTDAGKNWVAAITPDRSNIVDVAVSDSNDLFVSTSTGVFSGQPWSKSLANISADLDSVGGYTLAIDGAGRLFVSTAGRGIWEFVGAPPRALLSTDDRSIDVSIFPNPAVDVIRVVGNGITRVTIVDMLGVLRKRVDYSVPVNTNELDIKDLRSGTFLIRIESANGEAVRRFLKG